MKLDSATARPSVLPCRSCSFSKATIRLKGRLVTRLVPVAMMRRPRRLRARRRRPRAGAGGNIRRGPKRRGAQQKLVRGLDAVTPLVVAVAHPNGSWAVMSFVCWSSRARGGIRPGPGAWCERSARALSAERAERGAQVLVVARGEDAAAALAEARDALQSASVSPSPASTAKIHSSSKPSASSRLSTRSSPSPFVSRSRAVTSQSGRPSPSVSPLRCSRSRENLRCAVVFNRGDGVCNKMRTVFS